MQIVAFQGFSFWWLWRKQKQVWHDRRMSDYLYPGIYQSPLYITCIQVYTSLHSTLLVYTVGIYQSTFIYCRYTITIYQSTCIQVYYMLDSFCLDICMYCILYPSMYPGIDQNNCSQVYVRLLLSRYRIYQFLYPGIYYSLHVSRYMLAYFYPYMSYIHTCLQINM